MLFFEQKIVCYFTPLSSREICVTDSNKLVRKKIIKRSRTKNLVGIVIRLALIESEIEMKDVHLSCTLNQIEIKAIGVMRWFSFNDKFLAYGDVTARDSKNKWN